MSKCCKACLRHKPKFLHMLGLFQAVQQTMHLENCMSTWVSKHQEEFKLHGTIIISPYDFSCISWIQDQEEFCAGISDQNAILTWTQCCWKPISFFFPSLQVIFMYFTLIQYIFLKAVYRTVPLWTNIFEICMPGLQDFLISASQQGLRRSKIFSSKVVWHDQSKMLSLIAMYACSWNREQTTKPGCRPRFKRGRWYPASMTSGQETLGRDNCKTL